MDVLGGNCTHPSVPTFQHPHRPGPRPGALNAWSLLRALGALAPLANLLEPQLRACLGAGAVPAALCVVASVAQASQKSCETCVVSPSVQMGKLRLWEAGEECSLVPSVGRLGGCVQRWGGHPPLPEGLAGCCVGSPEPCGHLTLSLQALREAPRAEESSVLTRAALTSRSAGNLSPPLCCWG